MWLIVMKLLKAYDTPQLLWFNFIIAWSSVFARFCCGNLFGLISFEYKWVPRCGLRAIFESLEQLPIWIWREQLCSSTHGIWTGHGESVLLCYL